MASVREEWRPIPGFEGKYEISNKGRIKSLDRIVYRNHRCGRVIAFRWKGRIMASVYHKGYCVNKLGSDKRLLGVHQMVAWAFIGPCPEGMVVNHIDGNKHNNRPENLEYVTPRENTLHQYRIGLLDNSGENNPNSRTSKLKRLKCG
jgi:hypothetical protein